MALLMVMTVCLLVYAALEYRIRQALRSQHETFPDQKGRPIQHPDSAHGSSTSLSESMCCIGGWRAPCGGEPQ